MKPEESNLLIYTIYTRDDEGTRKSCFYDEKFGARRIVIPVLQGNSKQSIVFQYYTIHLIRSTNTCATLPNVIWKPVMGSLRCSLKSVTAMHLISILTFSCRHWMEIFSTLQGLKDNLLQASPDRP
uniref:Uncharacterized protein n=1 Tax=Arundo donax TaxID=35708 RepID=A0A0A9HP55_ARUDO